MQKLKALQEKKKLASEPQNATTDEKTTSNGHTENKENASSQSVFSLKNKSKGQKSTKTRANAAELRAQKDISEMDPVPGTKISFPDANNIMKFDVSIRPSDGLYSGATFNFAVEIPNSYPYDPPKVVCNTLVYHPNIDFDGKVCLNILRQEWMPVLSLGSVVFGLMTLFLEPNADDPLNKEAAQLMLDKPSEFQRNVKDSLKGNYVAGRKFQKLL